MCRFKVTAQRLFVAPRSPPTVPNMDGGGDPFTLHTASGDGERIRHKDDEIAAVAPDTELEGMILDGYFISPVV